MKCTNPWLFDENACKKNESKQNLRNEIGILGSSDSGRDLLGVRRTCFLLGPPAQPDKHRWSQPASPQDHRSRLNHGTEDFATIQSVRSPLLNSETPSIVVHILVRVIRDGLDLRAVPQ